MNLAFFVLMAIVIGFSVTFQKVFEYGLQLMFHVKKGGTQCLVPRKFYQIQLN